MLSRWIGTSAKGALQPISRRSLHSSPVVLKKRKGATTEAEAEDYEDDFDAPSAPEEDLFSVSSSSSDPTLDATRRANLLAEQMAAIRRHEIQRIVSFTGLTHNEMKQINLTDSDKPIRRIVQNTNGLDEAHELKAVLKRWRAVGGVVTPETGSAIANRLKNLKAESVAEEILASPTQYGVFTSS